MGIRYKKIDHVQLAAPAGSEDQARKFYGQILAMQEVPKPANLAKRGGVWFQCGTNQVHIGIQNEFSPAVKAHPAFEVENLEELQQKLTEQNISIKDDDLLEGAERFYVNDPFGNRLEFLKWKK
ncbi:VOC family protein [Mesobacillus zeae]|uniref:Glyoxalase n=1 Tax=Mesobacillus zeae TaxID=1917180 RepID=A0A398BEA8_9BACI|nr:VOC family protein [Mesobacillus zeae]RID88312.1 glyoxalase [Mesobacillus zeae]